MEKLDLTPEQVAEYFRVCSQQQVYVTAAGGTGLAVQIVPAQIAAYVRDLEKQVHALAMGIARAVTGQPILPPVKS